MNDLSFRKSIAVSVAALCEAFGKTPSEATFRAYELGLSGMSPAMVQKATALALRSCRFMPPPVELRELVATSGQGIESRAMQAWGIVEKAVVSHGYMKTVAFDDPLINAAINVTGRWQRYCSVSLEEFDKWLRKEFLAAYMAFTKSPPSPALCEPSPGEAARVNGFHHDHDRLVSIATGLPLGPVQLRLAESREGSKRADVPRVEFQKV